MTYDPFALASLSNAVYDNAEEEKLLAKVVGYVPARRYKHNDTQATLFLPAASGGRPVLAIRGTEFLVSWTDFFRNIGWPVSWGGQGKVHRGYLRSYNMIRKHVLQLAEEFPTLIITGHSLGGATATIAAADLNAPRSETDPREPYTVVTFGAPPCVGKSLAKVLSVDRYVVANDFAPKIPGWIVGLYHPKGPRVKLVKQGRFPARVSAHWGSVYMEKLEDLRIYPTTSSS